MQKLLEILSQYNIWQGKEFPEGFRRAFYLDKLHAASGNRLIKVIVGQRRSGKSFILRQFINFLVRHNLAKPQNIFYLNKELVAFDQIDDYKELTQLFELYLSQIADSGKVYIFLDEVQQIAGWEKFVLSYSQDFSHDYEIYVTGSNSKMLSTELATLLAGRYIELQVFPYSYEEFLGVTGKSKSRDTFIEYLKFGGLPELFNLNDKETILYYLESLRDTIILRDIVHHYAIKDIDLLESIFKFLSLNIGNLTSAASIVKYFKSVGKKVNYLTVADYLSYLTYTMTFHRAERMNIKTKEVLKREAKFYLNDLSFKHGLFGPMNFEPAAALENYVYMTFKRFGYKVYVGTYREYEIDFIATKGNDLLYVQVAYMIDSKQTLEREVGNLLRIKDAYPKVLITLDDYPLENISGVKHIRAFDLENAESLVLS